MPDRPINSANRPATLYAAVTLDGSNLEPSFFVPGAWRDGPAALGRRALGEAGLRPPIPVDGGFVIADARLDNAPALLAVFGAGLSDADLAARAWARWGDDCPAHLSGDWSLIAWDPARRRMFAARDAQGCTALHYAAQGNTLVFATSLPGVLGAGRTVDELYLAQILVAWPAFHGERTAYADVRRLPPAHALALEDGRLRAGRYAHLEDAPPARLPSREAYRTALADQFDRAVAAGLIGVDRPAIMLSGGLDSGSIASLAARRLAREGRRLLAFTAAPLEAGPASVGRRLRDETALAEAVASAAGNIDLRVVRAERPGIMAALRRALEIGGEPMFAASNAHWLLAVHAAAQAEGADAVLTGQMGNVTVSWAGRASSHDVAALARAGRWRAIARKAALASTSVTRGLRSLARRRFALAGWPGTAIHPAFADRLRLAERMAEADFDPSFRWESLRPPRDVRLSVLLPGRTCVGAIYAQHGAAHGLRVIDPTADAALAAFCLGIPDAFFSPPAGPPRALIREAMAGVLPDAVRLNTRRGLQAADIARRLVAERAEVEEALAALDRSPGASAVLNLGRMRAVWARAQAEPDAAPVVRDVQAVLLRGLMAGMFLME